MSPGSSARSTTTAASRTSPPRHSCAPTRRAGASLVVVLRSRDDYAPVYYRLQRSAPSRPKPRRRPPAGCRWSTSCATILRAVAIVDGLVCLYALIQACTLTVQERRRSIAVLRACGAGGAAVRRLLLGAAMCLVIPAAAIGVVLERFVLGPELSHLAINYATLNLDPAAWEIGAVVAGLVLCGVVAVVWVAAQATRESVLSGLAMTLPRLERFSDLYGTCDAQRGG